MALLALAALLPAQADYSNTVMSLNPVAYWRLNEPSPLPTTVTNYGSLGAVANGSYYGWGSTWNSSPHGAPGALAGDTDTATTFYLAGVAPGRILIPWNATINPNPPQPFTVECWHYPFTGGGFGTLVHSMVAGDNPDNNSDRSGWNFRAHGANLRFAAGTPNATYTIVEATGIVQLNAWQHFVAVYDGANATLYANGVQVASGAFPLLPNLVSQTAIGGRGEKYDGWNCDGLIDEVAIYTKVLSPSEILAHYQNGTNTNPGIPYHQLITSQHPIVYYRLNEWPIEEPPPVPVVNRGSWGANADGSYSLLGGASGGVPGVPYHGFGTDNTAYKFTGAGESYIEIPPQSLASDSVTITCWAKRNGISDSWSMLYSNPSDLGLPDNGPSAPVTGLGFGEGGDPVDAHNDLLFYWSGAQGNTGDTGTAPDPAFYMPDQEWTFVALVASPTNLVLYLNGQSVTNTPITPYGPHDFGTVASFIGKKQKYGGFDGTEVNGFKGTIDEVAIFNAALTDAQIRQLYASAEVPPPVLGFTQNGDGTFTLSWTKGMLLEATKVTGAWTTNATAVSPFKVTPNKAEQQRYYRLLVP
jgi:hypothetical protein